MTATPPAHGEVAVDPAAPVADRGPDGGGRARHPRLAPGPVLDRVAPGWSRVGRRAIGAPRPGGRGGRENARDEGRGWPAGGRGPGVACAASDGPTDRRAA